MKAALNITMIVFNRYEITQKAIIALKKSSQTIPFVVTVVDNGSEKQLVQRLIDFKNDGIIDNLFLLPKNMGIACAGNIGWEMIDADFYMKLDNDTVMIDRHWLPKLFKIWRHLDPVSNLGGAYDMEHLTARNPPIHTPDGVAGICDTNLPGQAIIIPKNVSDILGVWNDDYGLYGAEDGDYGVRMNCAGFKQYYYCGSDYFINLGVDDAHSEYESRNVDKKKEYAKLWCSDCGEAGLFPINHSLYNLCIRSWKVSPRYAVRDISNKYTVILHEKEEYKNFRKALDTCVDKIRYRVRAYGNCLEKIFTEKFIAELKVIMNDIGCGCG